MRAAAVKPAAPFVTLGAQLVHAPLQQPLGLVARAPARGSGTRSGWGSPGLGVCLLKFQPPPALCPTAADDEAHLAKVEAEKRAHTASSAKVRLLMAVLRQRGELAEAKARL